MPFVWAYGARELIVERKSVGKIVALRAAVECVKIGDCNRNFGSQFHFLDVPMSFHEAFVSSDEQRARVVRRVHMHYDLDRKNNVVALRTADFPETAPGRFRNEVALLEKEVSRWATGVEQYYAIARSTMAQHLERVLLMQALCEELRLETCELVTRCVSFEELDHSMLVSAI